MYNWWPHKGVDLNGYQFLAPGLFSQKWIETKLGFDIGLVFAYNTLAIVIPACLAGSGLKQTTTVLFWPTIRCCFPGLFSREWIETVGSGFK
jgi:hypothetical protein